MATPWAAGQAALIYSLNAQLDVRQIAELMVGTARSVDGANPKFRGKLGGGLPALDVSLARLNSGNLPNVGGVMSGSCVEVTVSAVAGSAPAPTTASSGAVQQNSLFLPVVSRS